MGASAAIDRLYRRLGSRVVLVSIPGATAVFVLSNVLAMVGVARYLQLSLSGFWFGVALVSSVFLVVAAWALFSTREVFRVALSWSGEGRSPQRAPDVWSVLVVGPSLVARRLVIGGACGLLVTSSVATVHFHEPWWAFFPIVIGGMGAILGAGVLAAFGGDLVLKPMLQDVAKDLPVGFDPPQMTWRLQVKALAPLPAVTYFAALGVGAFADVGNTGAARVSVAVGISVAAIAASVIVFAIVMRSTLGPLDDLLDATRRVRGGDLGTRVRVVTADDLGQLSSSFNLMMDGLQERDSLREQNTALLDDLRASRARVIAASDAERRRVERNIHDGAQQRLVALALKLRVLEERARDDESLRDGLAASSLLLKDALAELRELARGLHPAVLTTDGLGAALGQLAEHNGGQITVTVPEVRFSAEIESAAYFIACEGLANVAKYAQASSVEMRVAQRNGCLVVTIADDGIGGADPAGGSGLTGLSDRVGALNGRLSITSPPGRGTTLTAELPLA